MGTPGEVEPTEVYTDVALGGVKLGSRKRQRRKLDCGRGLRVRPQWLRRKSTPCVATGRGFGARPLGEALPYL